MYVNEPSLGVTNVWLMRADGTGKTRVTSSGDVTGMPSWSPDGTRIAFAKAGRLATVRSIAPFGAPTVVMGMYPVENTDSTTYYPPETVAVNTHWTWAPDGSGIWVLNGRSGMFDNAVWAYNPATNLMKLMREGGDRITGGFMKDFPTLALIGVFATTGYTQEVDASGTWTGQALDIVEFLGIRHRC